MTVSYFLQKDVSPVTNEILANHKQLIVNRNVQHLAQDLEKQIISRARKQLNRINSGQQTNFGDQDTHNNKSNKDNKNNNSEHLKGFHLMLSFPKISTHN